MVDFNAEGTMSKPPREVIALVIIEKLYNFLEADEYYSKNRFQSGSISLGTSRARLRSLFLVCHQMIKRRLTHSEFEELKLVCTDFKEKIEIDRLVNAFTSILNMLDKLGLTKLDTKKVYDRTRTELANKEHGY